MKSPMSCSARSDPMPHGDGDSRFVLPYSLTQALSAGIVLHHPATPQIWIGSKTKSGTAMLQTSATFVPHWWNDIIGTSSSPAEVTAAKSLS